MSTQPGRIIVVNGPCPDTLRFIQLPKCVSDNKSLPFAYGLSSKSDDIDPIDIIFLEL